MHHITNVEIENPIILVFDPQNISHIKLKLVIKLQKINLCIIMKRNFHWMFLFIFFIAKHEASFAFFEITYSSKLSYYSLKFIDGRLNFHYDIFNYLSFFFNIVSFISSWCLGVYRCSRVEILLIRDIISAVRIIVSFDVEVNLSYVNVILIKCILISILSWSLVVRLLILQIL